MELVSFSRRYRRVDGMILFTVHSGEIKSEPIRRIISWDWLVVVKVPSLLDFLSGCHPIPT